MKIRLFGLLMLLLGLLFCGGEEEVSKNQEQEDSSNDEMNSVVPTEPQNACEYGRWLGWSSNGDGGSVPKGGYIQRCAIDECPCRFEKVKGISFPSIFFGNERRFKILDTIEIANHYLYVLDRDYSLYAFDLSSPTAPMLVKELSSDFRASAHLRGRLAAEHPYLYYTQGKYLNIVDISDPADMKWVSRMKLEGYPVGFQVYQGVAYVVHGTLEEEAEEDAKIEAKREAGEIYVRRTFHNALFTYDVTDAANPRRIGQFIDNNAYYGLAFQGQYAFVSNHFKTVLILDISYPAQPFLVSQIDMDGRIASLQVDQEKAYIFDTESLLVYDVSNPKTPEPLGDYGWGFGSCSKRENDTIYVVDGSNVISLIDISDSDQPRMRGVIPYTGALTEFKVYQGLAYIVSIEKHQSGGSYLHFSLYENVKDGCLLP